MFSGRYKMKLVDNVMYEVYGKVVTEDVDEGADEVFEFGVDFASTHGLVETPPFDKEGFMLYLNEYKREIAQKLQESNPDQVDVFKRNINKVVKKLLDRFENLEFFTESMDPDGMVVIIEYRKVDGDNIQVLYAFKHGLEEIERF